MTCTIKSIFDSESKGLFLGNLRQDKKDNGRKRYAMIQRWEMLHLNINLKLTKSGQGEIKV